MAAPAFSPATKRPLLRAFPSTARFFNPESDAPWTSQIPSPTVTSSSTDAPQRIHFHGLSRKMTVTVANWRSCSGMPNLMNWAVV